jgi:sulfoxide reductase heme-binding subunit YedZ
VVLKARRLWWEHSGIWAVALTLPVLGWAGRFFSDSPPANPVEFLLIQTGEAAVYLLVLTLLISPFRILLPRFEWPRRLAAKRRLLGLSTFAYTGLHFLIYLLDRLDFQAVLEDLTRWFLLSGFLAFGILGVLALTSSNRMIKRLGGRRWRRLHRVVYLAAALAFWHMILKEKHAPWEALVLFGGLSLFEAGRVLHPHLKPRPSGTGSSAPKS